MVQQAWRSLPADAIAGQEFAMARLFFQTNEDGQVKAMLIAFFCAVMAVRRQLLEQTGSRSNPDIPNLILKALECP